MTTWSAHSRNGVFIAALLATAVLAGWAAAAGAQWEPYAAATAGVAGLALFAIGVAWPFGGLVAWLCVLPFFDALAVGPPGVPLTAGHAALAGLLAGWIVRMPATGSGIPRSAVPLLAALGGLPVAGLVSAAAAPDAMAALGASARLALMVGIAAAVAALARDDRRARTVLGTLVAVGAAMSGVALVQLLFPELEIGRAAVQGLSAFDEVVRPAAFFRDPNFLGGYLSACAAAAMAVTVRSRKLNGAAPWLAGGAACAIGVLVTSSRSALVGLGAGAVFVVATAPKRRRAVMAIALLAVVLAAAPLVPRGVWGRMAQLLRPAAATSLSTRYLMAISDVRMFAERAPAGIGLGAHDAVYPEYRLPGALPRITHPHQVPLSFVAETGVPGALALLGAAIAAALAAKRMARSGWRPLAAATTAGVVVLVVESLFQYYLFFEYLWIFLGLFASASGLEPQEQGGARAV